MLQRSVFIFLIRFSNHKFYLITIHANRMQLIVLYSFEHLYAINSSDFHEVIHNSINRNQIHLMILISNVKRDNKMF